MTRERPGQPRLPRTEGWHCPLGFPASPHLPTGPRSAGLCHGRPEAARWFQLIRDEFAAGPQPHFLASRGCWPCLPCPCALSVALSHAEPAPFLGREGHIPCMEPPDLMPAHLPPASCRDSALKRALKVSVGGDRADQVSLWWEVHNTEVLGAALCLGDGESQGGEESDLRGAVSGEVVGGQLGGG